MSTIKPLATIAVLAALGVFLALEINKQESVSLDTGWGEAALTEGGSAPLANAKEAPAFNAADTSITPRTAPNGLAATDNGEVSPFDKVEKIAPAPATPVFAPAIKSPASVATTPTPAAPAAELNTGLSVADLPALPDLPVETSRYGTPAQTETVNTQAAGYEASETTPLNFGAPTNNVTPAMSPVTPIAADNGFAAAWQKIQEALSRNELTRAHLLASEWRGAPMLSPMERGDVDRLLGELAGTVVYSMEHRLEPAHVVREGETLMTISEQYDIPWELLAKINGVATPSGIQPGQQLKVLRGPFNGEVLLSSSELVLMLDDRYAGKFAVQISGMVGSSSTWKVDRKQILPSNGTMARQIVFRNETGASFVLTDMDIPADTYQGQLRVASNDATDLYDILSVGSVVSIRR